MWKRGCHVQREPTSGPRGIATGFVQHWLFSILDVFQPYALPHSCAVLWLAGQPEWRSKRTVTGSICRFNNLVVSASAAQTSLEFSDQLWMEILFPLPGIPTTWSALPFYKVPYLLSNPTFRLHKFEILLVTFLDYWRRCWDATNRDVRHDWWHR